MVKARELLPDLILMDIQMPVVDGYTATRRLKADPVTAGIKVLALTSYAMKGEKERYMEAGFDDYMTKPIDTRQLADIVRRHLNDAMKPGPG
ncbi:MAG: response regulator [Thermodesulfovibrionales bacterium]